MRRTLAVSVATLLVGCALRPQPGAVWFLGVPEAAEGGTGPVGLINGQPCQVRTVTTVSEVPWADYVRAKRQSRITQEEIHGDYVYFAVEEQRDVPFDDATALVGVVARFKSRCP